MPVNKPLISSLVPDTRCRVVCKREQEANGLFTEWAVRAPPPILTNWGSNEKPDLHLSKIMCSPDGFCERQVVVVPTGFEPVSEP